jgi:hypothetical protein
LEWESAALAKPGLIFGPKLNGEWQRRASQLRALCPQQADGTPCPAGTQLTKENAAPVWGVGPQWSAMARAEARAQAQLAERAATAANPEQIYSNADLEFVRVEQLQKKNRLMSYEGMGRNILARQPAETMPTGYKKRGALLHRLVHAGVEPQDGVGGGVGAAAGPAPMTDGASPRTYASVVASTAATHLPRGSTQPLSRRRRRVGSSPQASASSARRPSQRARQGSEQQQQQTRRRRRADQSPQSSPQTADSPAIHHRHRRTRTSSRGAHNT